jgi:hypothetical protein
MKSKLCYIVCAISMNCYPRTPFIPCTNYIELYLLTLLCIWENGIVDTTSNLGEYFATKYLLKTKRGCPKRLVTLIFFYRKSLNFAKSRLFYLP